MSDDNCLDAASPDGPVKLVRCHGMGGNQAWVYNDEVSVYCPKSLMVFDGLRWSFNLKFQFNSRIRLSGTWTQTNACRRKRTIPTSPNYTIVNPIPIINSGPWDPNSNGKPVRHLKCHSFWRPGPPLAALDHPYVFCLWYTLTESKESVHCACESSGLL